MTNQEIEAALDKCADEMEALQDYKRNIWRREDEIREQCRALFALRREMEAIKEAQK